MKNEDLFNAFSGIDEKLLEKSERPSGLPVRPAVITAACAVAALLLVFGIFKLINSRSPVPGGQTAAASPEPTAEPLATRIPRSDEGSSAQLIAGWSFDMAMDISPYIFEGTCLSAQNAGSGSMLSPMPSCVFRVERVFRGDLKPGDGIIVRTAEDFGFETGKTHLIFAEPFASVFEQIERYYAPLAVCREDQSGVMLGDGVTGLRDLDHDGVIAYLTEKLPSHPFTGTLSVIGEYCASSELSDIAAYSELIVSVRADEVLMNEFNARTTYRCTVTEVFKGGCAETIEVTAFKNSMEIGSEYLLLLIKPDATSVGYTMSSVRSVLELSSDEARTVIGLIK